MEARRDGGRKWGTRRSGFRGREEEMVSVYIGRRPLARATLRRARSGRSRWMMNWTVDVRW